MIVLDKRYKAPAGFYVGIDHTGQRIEAHQEAKCMTTASYFNGQRRTAEFYRVRPRPSWFITRDAYYYDMPLAVPLAYVDSDDPGQLEQEIIQGLHDLGWPIINFPCCDGMQGEFVYWFV